MAANGFAPGFSLDVRQDIDHVRRGRQYARQLLLKVAAIYLVHGIIMPKLVNWISDLVDPFLQNWLAQALAGSLTCLGLQFLLHRLRSLRSYPLKRDLLRSIPAALIATLLQLGRNPVLPRFTSFNTLYFINIYLLYQWPDRIMLYVDQQVPDVESFVQIGLETMRALCFVAPTERLLDCSAFMLGAALMWPTVYHVSLSKPQLGRWKLIEATYTRTSTQFTKLSKAWGAKWKKVRDYQFKRQQQALSILPQLRYQPLGPREIRLVQIVNKLPFQAPRCRMLTVSIDEAPPYEAISHAWEYPVKYINVSVNVGLQMQVPSRIYHFLCHRRSYLKSKFVWIDALCIDQEDLDERAAQVKIMRDIFVSATRVVVWLAGPDEVKDGSSVRHYLWLTRFLRTFSNGSVPRYSPATDRALRCMLRQRWFQRVWIVQEVALAKQILILYGSVCLGWWEIDAFVSLLLDPRFSADRGLLTDLDNGLHGSRHIQSFGNIVCMTRLRNQVWDDRMCLLKFSGNSHPTNPFESAKQQLQNFTKRDSLLYLELVLVLTTGFDATDSRDRLFALLGIIQDPDGRLPSPDYSSSFNQVYVRTMTSMLTAGHSPATSLRLAGIGLLKEGLIATLQSPPSWIPDYLSRGGSNGKILKNMSSDREHNINITADSEKLFARAVSLDRIARVGPMCKVNMSELFQFGFDPNFREALIKAMASWILDTRSFVLGDEHRTSREPDMTLEFDDECFWRTIFADQYAHQSPISPEMLASVNRYLGMLCQELLEGSGLPEDAPEKELIDLFTTWTASFGATSLGRRFAVSQKGQYVLVPPLTRKDDVICMFEGLPEPFLLRAGDAGYWQLVGACYVDLFEPAGKDFLARQGFETITII